MSDAPSHTMFFGDAERSFALPAELIIELERKTDTGIGALSRRFYAGDFRHQELIEIVRLGLVGGGTDPKEAAALVAAYAQPLPVMELYAVALPVMDTTMFGPAKKKGKRK